MWISVASFLTPTVLLFCVLNLTIFTIFITSTLKKLQKLSDDQDNSPPQLIRVPLLLKRVKSISLFNYRSEQPDQFETAAHPTTSPPRREEPTHRQESEGVEESHVTRSRSDTRSPPPPEEPTHRQESECVEVSHVTRSRSDTLVQAPRKRVLKKSASEKAFVAEPEEEEEEEEEDRRRPATVKETAPSNWAEDEAVDSRADDFIDNFRQQLKLQRSGSITRYNEMLDRGLRN